MARRLQVNDRRKVVVLYEKGRLWRDAWENNPRIATPGEVGNFQQYWARSHYLRPYMESKTKDRWTWKAYAPERGELYFSPEELDYGARFPGRIIFEPHIKAGASCNKTWGWVRWNKLAYLAQQGGFRVTQVGPPGTQLLAGAELIPTTLRLAAAVIANARALVVPEGGLHHTAAAVNTPAVVIYGGFISPQVTGYAGQINFFHPDRHVSHLGCGLRVPCKHCTAAMDAITPEAVFEGLKRILLIGNSASSNV